MIFANELSTKMTGMELSHFNVAKFASKKIVVVESPVSTEREFPCTT